MNQISSHITKQKTRRALRTMTFASIFVGVLLFAFPAFAAIVEIPNYTSITNIPQFIAEVTKFLLGMAGSLAILAIIYGGLRYVISRGEESEIKEAKVILTYAIVGLVVILLAYTIVSTVNIYLLK